METKTIIPQSIKHLVIAFDVSTSNTGYAILADNTPIAQVNGKPAIGSIKMVKQETSKYGNKKDVQYENYGNRMIHGSWEAFTAISNILYHVLKPMTDAYYASKKEEAPKQAFNIEKITLVFEVSEIPNFSKNMGQTITTTRKLALYTGATIAVVRNIIGLVFEP